ncbi:RNA polymerase sigma factor [Enhygromyxa salina]|uniref:RNA polymerase sigma factor n=1 Tax=Enhygromyxa salina TaxID=215803 RepID=UPI0015E61122|nr:sigma-70 family RNA polymerase sigma factor [Enhygromyxa salina]
MTRHVGVVRAYFGRRVSGPDGEDLVQETLSRLTRAIRGFQARSSFKTYLLSIAKNTFNDYLRRGYRRVSVESLEDGAASEDPLAERWLLELERHGLALDCVQQLSPETREFVERFYWQDTSARALGSEKGIPAGTVRRRLFDARASMRESYRAAQGEHARCAGGVEVEIDQLRAFLCSGAT